MKFENELKNGNFLISECSKCKKIVWPPSAFCNQCLTETVWKTCDKKGKILEFSKKDNTFFCVIEIENSIKLIAEVESGTPEVGATAIIKDFGIKEGNYFFKLAV